MVNSYCGVNHVGRLIHRFHAAAATKIVWLFSCKILKQKKGFFYTRYADRNRLLATNR